MGIFGLRVFWVILTVRLEGRRRESTLICVIELFIYIIHIIICDFGPTSCHGINISQSPKLSNNQLVIYVYGQIDDSHQCFGGIFLVRCEPGDISVPLQLLL
jgi:hypothetical protein